MPKFIALLVITAWLHVASLPLSGGLAIVQAADDFRAAKAPLTRSAQTVSELKLKASPIETGAGFGNAVDIDGTWAIVGAPRDKTAGVATGAAYIFQYDGTTWRQVARLLASDGGAADQFGSAVALDGAVAVIGASGDDQKGFNSGAAYVFRRSGSTWTEEAKLMPNSANDMSFGFTVAVEGDTVAVGAPYSFVSGTSTNSGSAYVFHRANGVWGQAFKFATYRGGAVLSDLFGWSVALSGNTLAVGAYLDDTVFIFERAGGVWSRTTQFDGADTDAGDRFGYAVALDGDTLVVGAAQDNDMSTSAGSAYVFQRSGSTWTQQTKLVLTSMMTGARLGWSVAIDNDTLIVGARESKGNQDRVEAGAAYVYERSSGSWTLSQALFANAPASGDHYGHAVAIDTGTAWVGAPDEDTGGLGSGAAYVYAGLGSGGGGDDDDNEPPPNPCLTMQAAETNQETIAPNVTLSWTSAFRCENAPDTGSYEFTVAVTNTANSALTVIEALTLTHTTPRPNGQGPIAEGAATGLPINVAPGESQTFTVSGDYALVNTEEGQKANLHFCMSGAADGKSFYLGLNALFRGPGATEDDADASPPIVSNISITERPTSATVRWSTNEPALGRVRYSAGSTLSLSSASGCQASTIHKVDIYGLFPDTVYNFQIEVSDGAGNVATSEIQQFTTPILGPFRFYVPLLMRK